MSNYTIYHVVHTLLFLLRGCSEQLPVFSNCITHIFEYLGNNSSHITSTNSPLHSSFFIWITNLPSTLKTSTSSILSSASQNAIFKNYPKYIYEKTTFTEYNKNQILCLKSYQTHSLTHSLYASLSCKATEQTKQFYDTRINSQVGCAFWGSDECAPSAPCLSL